jgi:hypothetical protein
MTGPIQLEDSGRATNLQCRPDCRQLGFQRNTDSRRVANAPRSHHRCKKDGGFASMWKMKMLASTTAALLFLVTITGVHSQVGETLCACSPTVFQFTLSFSQSCEDNTLMSGSPGIQNVNCTILPSNADSENLVPVRVSSIEVAEFDQNLDPLTEAAGNVDFANGAMFTYTTQSFIPEAVNSTSVPRQLQMTLTGSNSADEQIVMRWTLTYSNSCDDYPVIIEGDQIGWTVFVRFNC